MAKSGARLKDIAEATGFSVNTVSLALRRSPRIPDDTRQRIEAAAARLNYLPNQIAKSLVSKETKSIGLILTDVQNPVLTNVAQAVQRELAKRGYTTLFATSNNTFDEEEQMIAAFLARRADGMLVFPFNHSRLDHIRKLRERNYPVVLLVGDQDSGLDTVSMNEEGGAWKAVSHLLATGHRRIALIDGAQILGNSEKFDGYMRAHRDVGVVPDPALQRAPEGHSVEAGYWAMAALVESGAEFSALFATNDSLALGALRFAAQRGIAVPGEISIIGFDNIEFGAFAVTPLSSVSYDVARISSLAVSRILDLIGHEGDLPPPRVIQVDSELVIRESSGPCRKGPH